jgi:succinate dehydrogenase / fumarate reductase cytochrome b subunit
LRLAPTGPDSRNSIHRGGVTKHGSQNAIPSGEFMQSIVTYTNGILRYRPHEGMVAFLLHRISGLATLLFLGIHIVDTSLVYFFPGSYNDAIGLYRTPFFMGGEIALVAGVIYHGINGARIALFDLFFPAAWNRTTEKQSVWITILISFILWLPAGIIMGRNFIGYTFLGW